MSTHESRRQNVGPDQGDPTPDAALDNMGRKPRPASSGFVVRSALRAGESQDVPTALDKFQQWFHNLRGQSG